MAVREGRWESSAMVEAAMDMVDHHANYWEAERMGLRSRASTAA